MAEITAAEIRELTRHWPDRAKASIGYTTANGGGWVQMDGTDLSPALAAELQAMTGLRWLSKDRTVALCGNRIKLGDYDAPLREWNNYDGPSILRAVSAAVMAINGSPEPRPIPEPDITTCPNCGGPADNGFSREVPPSPYYCTKCEFSPRP